jgi:uncharacterized protein (DUF924 family)
MEDCMTFNEIIKFWFEDIESNLWYKKDDEFDALLRSRFLNVHGQIVDDKCKDWRKYSEGSLAEVIVLDQFSRNMFRDSEKAFAYDPQSLQLAKNAILEGQDKDLSPKKRAFLYMPFMHSESLADHDEAMRLFDQPGLEGNLSFENAHRTIIEKFGRYPHRNAVLGRESTAEELEYLKENSGF